MSRTVSVCAFVCLFSAVTEAELVPFSIIGTVNQVLQTPPAPFEGVRVGDPFRVNFTLDDSTPDQDTVENLATYSGAHLSYEVIIGGESVTTTDGGVNTSNAIGSAPGDTYASVGIFDDFVASVSFSDLTGDAIGPDDDLSTIDLSGFSHRQFTLLAGQTPALTGFVIVPEPSAMALFSTVAAIGFVAARRRSA